MNIVCIICSDGISPSSEVYTTHCGHLFHYSCLLQWIERSKTCPQCRNKSTEKTIHRVYFNIGNTEGNGDDIATLQQKYDNVQFQLMLKEKDIKGFTEKYSKVKNQNIGLRKEVSELENTVRTHDSVIHALKDQIAFFKSKANERDKFVGELTALKSKLKQMESIDLVVNGTREDVNEMLKHENDVDSLVILVATLKKALLDVEKKKIHIEHKYKHLENDLTKQRKEIASLEALNQQLKQENELAKIYSRKSINNTSKVDDTSEQNRSKILVSTKKVFSPQPQSNTSSSTFSPSVEEKVVNILNSDSPYLSLKHSSAPVDMKLQKVPAAAQSSLKHMSIFKKSKVPMIRVKTVKPENVVYDGLGGQGKEDLFPRAANSSRGEKRYHADSSIGSKRPRKTNSSKFQK